MAPPRARRAHPLRSRPMYPCGVLCIKRDGFVIARIRRVAMALGLQLALAASAAIAADVAERVEFSSSDGSTKLVGYIFAPTAPPPWPAVVMLHGRSGPYSTAAKGVYDAGT